MPRPLPIALGLVLLAATALRAQDGAVTVVAIDKLAHVYPHKSLTAQSFGAGARSYWIFEPAGPTPEKAPVVVFSHGWMAINPGIYGAWIEHLVRSGRIVVDGKIITPSMPGTHHGISNREFACHQFGR